MPQPRAAKERVVEDLTSRLANAQSVYLTDFSGLNVEAITELRRILRNESIECHVVKNTLSRFATERAGLPRLDTYLEGPTALILAQDPVASAKIITDFGKKHENRPRIKGGVLTGAVLKAEQVQELASLPAREVLIGKMVGSIAAPINGLVFSLSGVLGNVVRVLAAVAQQKEAGETNAG
ncbi:MAG: 50S ribosomal protein L10 [candidate division Zixibacteria bacterium]|nr:50S ribosomal protein L10 [candidate division Zixibacteria bacterium]